MKLLAGLVAMLVACLGAPAFAQADDELMTVLDFGKLRAIVDELDFSVIDQGVDEDGDYYLEVESDTGLLFNLYGASCSTDNPAEACKGLNIVGTFTLETEADIRAVIDGISYAFIKVYASGDDVKIARYLIFDGGIMRENVKANVEIFASIADRVWGQLTDDDVLAD